MMISWFGISGLLKLMLIGNNWEVSPEPAKVLAPKPKIGIKRSLEYMSLEISSMRSRYWFYLETLGVCIEVPVLEKVRLARLKSIQMMGATWIIPGTRSRIETWFWSKANGPVRLQSWRACWFSMGWSSFLAMEWCFSGLGLDFLMDCLWATCWVEEEVKQPPLLSIYGTLDLLSDAKEEFSSWEASCWFC